MGKISVLDKETIGLIAAGEAVERPAAVAKELIENAIDAGAHAVTCEIKDGGIRLLRITDDGEGIAPEDVRTAFLRHATSKIRSADDLVSIGSLGFRGEALASIAAVSRMEVITKRRENIAGIRYVIEGSEERSYTEVGAPDGTTMIVRDLFFNTPARQKFLKSAVTEGAHIGAYLEQLALSRPEIAFSFIVNGQMRLETSGTGSLKDVIYHIFGRTVVQELLPVSYEENGIAIGGFIAKPSVNRSNRGYENYYINGRYTKSAVCAKAIEEGFHGKLMQHCYPFTALTISMDPALVDVNVHPAKMDVRFQDEKTIYDALRTAVAGTIKKSEMIVPAVIGKEEKETVSAKERKEERKNTPEPFEKAFQRERIVIPSAPMPEQKASAAEHDADYGKAPVRIPDKDPEDGRKAGTGARMNLSGYQAPPETARDQILRESAPYGAKDMEKDGQLAFFSREAVKQRRIIGQVFSTYWLIEFGEEMLIIDQHAAHEKVLYERLMKAYEGDGVTSQMISPPVILTLSAQDLATVETYGDAFASLGFELEEFGAREYKLSSVPYNLSGADPKLLFREILNGIENGTSVRKLPSYVHEIATEACKAAVKGGGRVSAKEMEALLDELMQCEDPYHCPHGRPTTISMKKSEFEKKFRRVL